jgi:alpha-1,2-mannosyltransferase
MPVPTRAADLSRGRIYLSMSSLGRLAAIGGTGCLLLWLVASAVMQWVSGRTGGWAWDFRAYYDAGQSYLHLHSPYVQPTLPNLTSEQNFVYPPPLAALFAPISLIPYPVAAVVFIVGSGVLLGVALRILGVRDWRCYGAVLLGVPVQQGLALGTLSPLLAVLLAVVWRYRDRTAIAAPAVALLVISKLFLWPVAILFLVTRRFRTLAAAVAISLAAAVATSLPLGVAVFSDYPRLVHAVSNLEATSSISLYSFAASLGLSSVQSTVASFAVGGLLVAEAFRCARRDESRAFRILVVAALALSPIVWGHYLVVLVVPLALWRPRFSPVWLALSWAAGTGFVFGRDVFLAATAFALVLTPVQAGIVDLGVIRRAFRLPGLGAVPRTAAIAALCIPALAVAIGRASSLSAVAALQPVSPGGSSGGAAFVRLLTDRSGVCWRTWTDAVPSGSRAELVSRRPAAVVARAPLGRDGSVVCAPLAASDASSLLSAYRHGSARYAFIVTSRSGAVVLRGALLRPDRAQARTLVSQRPSAAWAQDLRLATTTH